MLGNRVFRLQQDPHQLILVQFIQCRRDRQAPDKFRDQAIFDEVFGFDRVQHLAHAAAIILALDLGRETDAALFGALADDAIQPRERAAADKQDIGRVDLQKFLLRVLAPALRRHRGDGALDQLQQGLLHALARDIAGDGGVVGLARDLVDLVDINDAGLRLVNIVVTLLQDLLNDILHVLADIAGLGQGGGVGDRKRHVQEPRERLGQQGLAAAGRPDQQHIALGELDLGFLDALLQALVVIVNRHGEDLFGLVLADHVFIQDLVDLARGRQG